MLKKISLICVNETYFTIDWGTGIYPRGETQIDKSNTKHDTSFSILDSHLTNICIEYEVAFLFWLSRNCTKKICLFITQLSRILDSDRSITANIIFLYNYAKLYIWLVPCYWTPTYRNSFLSLVSLHSSLFSHVIQ